MKQSGTCVRVQINKNNTIDVPKRYLVICQNLTYNKGSVTNRGNYLFGGQFWKKLCLKGVSYHITSLISGLNIKT